MVTIKKQRGLAEEAALLACLRARFPNDSTHDLLKNGKMVVGEGYYSVSYGGKLVGTVVIVSDQQFTFTVYGD